MSKFAFHVTRLRQKAHLIFCILQIRRELFFICDFECECDIGPCSVVGI